MAVKTEYTPRRIENSDTVKPTVLFEGEIWDKMERGESVKVRPVIIEQSNNGHREIGIGIHYEEGPNKDFPKHLFGGYDDVVAAQSAVLLFEDISTIESMTLSDCYHIFKPASRTDFVSRASRLLKPLGFTQEHQLRNRLRNI